MRPRCAEPHEKRARVPAPFAADLARDDLDGAHRLGREVLLLIGQGSDRGRLNIVHDILHFIVVAQNANVSRSSAINSVRLPWATRAAQDRKLLTCGVPTGQAGRRRATTGMGSFRS